MRYDQQRKELTYFLRGTAVRASNFVVRHLRIELVIRDSNACCLVGVGVAGCNSRTPTRGFVANSFVTWIGRCRFDKTRRHRRSEAK